MSDSQEPTEYTDVDEAVGEAWEADTTPYERVREVLRHVYTPTAVDVIADDARTSPKTARKHLTNLADEGFASTATGEHGATLFRRSRESLVLEQAANILDRVSVAELTERVQSMREELAGYQTEFGVDSPEELTVEQTNQVLAGEAADAVDRELLQEWQTTRRNLAIANAALSIATAEQFVDDTDVAGGTTIPP